MKKLLLNLTLLSSLFANAQSVHDAEYVMNFSGGINKGVIGTSNVMQLGTNVVLAADKHGNSNMAIDINAVNRSQILIGAASYMQGSNFTVSFWYKRSTTVGLSGTWSHRPFFIAPNTSNNDYAEGTFLGFTSDGTKFRYGHINNSPGSVSNKEVNVSDTGVTVTEWNYYSLVREGNSLKLYINGALKDTATNVAFGNYNTQGSAYLGGLSVGNFGGYAAGSFDNFSVHKRAMTDAQALELYNYQMGDMHRTDIKAKFDFNLGAVATDSWGNFHGVAVNNPALGTDRFGNANSALSVTGTATNPQGIAIPYLNDYFSESGTIAFWYKPNDINQSGGTHMVFLPNEKRHAGNFSLNNNISVTQFNNGVNATTTTAPNGNINTNLGVMTGEWQHCAIVLNNTNLKTYLNGVLVGDYIVEGTGYRKNGGMQNITVGHMDFYNLKTSFNGLIDDLIIDKAIYSANDIELLAGDIPFVAATNPVPSYVANFSGNINGGVTGSLEAITHSSTVTLTADQFGNPNNAADTSGPNGLIYLNKAATVLEYNNLPYTISFWFKRNPNANKSGNLSYFSFFSIPNSSNAGYGEGLVLGLNMAETSFTFGYVLTTGSSGVNHTSQVDLPAGFIVNDWNYYTIEKVGNIIKLYVNNQFLAQKSGITFGQNNNNRKIILGGFQNGSYGSAVPGYFDNFRIYNAMLSPAERLMAYNWELSDSQRPTSFQAKYDFNSSIIADANGNFHAVVENDVQLGTDRNGNPNSALRITPNADATKTNGIRIPYLNDYFTRNQGTVSFWYKAEGTGTPYNFFNPIVTLPNQGLTAGNYAIAAGFTSQGNQSEIMRASSTLNDYYTSAVTETTTTTGWKHCAVTFEGQELKLYINGNLIGTGAISAFPTRVNGGAQDILVGFNEFLGTQSQFDGLIDDLIFDTNVMTATEIADLVGTLDTFKPEQNKVVAYPNPVENNLFFSQEVEKATVFDLFCRVILTAANTNQIDISSLAKGSYLVNFEINGTNTVQQIIKK